MESDLGLTPSNDGKIIRLPIPQLTEERRKDLVKVVRQRAEDGRVAVRNVRRDVMKHLEELVRNGEVGDDDERRAEERVAEADRRPRAQDRRAAEAQGSRDPRSLEPCSNLLRELRAACSTQGLPTSRTTPEIATVGRDHHGRQRPLGRRRRPAGRGGPPRRNARAAAAPSRRRSTSASSRSPSTRSRPRTGRAPTEEVERADGDLRRDDRARAARPRRARACACASSAGATARPMICSERMAELERETQAQRPPQPLDRVRLRRPRRARRGRAAARRSRASTREDVDENAFAAQLYAPATARPRPADPHLRASCASRTSCSGSSPTRSSSSSTRSGPTSAPRTCARRSARLRAPRRRRFGGR